MPQQCDQQFRVLSFLLLYFFNLSFFFCFSFVPLLLECLFTLYTMISTPFSPYTCELGVGDSPCPISHLLKPSTISCKAVCLLFRHHLHINAARELVRQHLIRRQQFLQIFVIPHPYLLSGIYPSLCRKVPLICYIQGLGRFLATSDRGSEMVIILGHS